MPRIIKPEDLGVVPEGVHVVDLGDANVRSQVVKLVGGKYTHRLIQRLDALNFDWVPDAQRTDKQMPKFSRRFWKAVNDKSYREDIDRWPTTYDTSDGTIARCAELVNAPRTEGRVLVDLTIEEEPPMGVWEVEASSTCMYGNGMWKIMAAIGMRFVKVAVPFSLEGPGQEHKPKLISLSKGTIVSYGGEYWAPLGRFVMGMVPDESGVMTPLIHNLYGIEQTTAQELVANLLGMSGTWSRVGLGYDFRPHSNFHVNNSSGSVLLPMNDAIRVVADGTRVKCAATGENAYGFQCTRVMGKWYLKGHEPEMDTCPECKREKEKGSSCAWCEIEKTPGYQGLFKAVELVEKALEEMGL